MIGRMQTGRAVSAALIVVAFGTGVVWGQSSGTAETRQATHVFSADAAVVLSYIKSAQTANFEQTMERLGEALSTSESAERRQQAAGWKVYKAEEPLESGVVLYISVLDPVVPGADYWVPQILNEGFPTRVQNLYETYVGAFADGQILLNLSPVSGS